MKKSIRVFGIFVLLLSTVTLLSSCKKDISDLPGTWEAVEATINGEEVKNLKDIWTLNADGTCTIECDIEKYTDNYIQGVVTFPGTYVTDDDFNLNIKSAKFYVWDDDYYDEISFDVEILAMTKKMLMVFGKFKYNRHEGVITTSKTAEATITFARK